MKPVYLETIQLIERLHRQFLEVVKSELDAQGIDDINNVQALILSHIGDEEITVGELTYRGYYLGSNVSYNVKKMVEYGYLEQSRARHDKRSVKLKASDKGRDLCTKIAAMYDRHVDALSDEKAGEIPLEQAVESLRRVEVFWGDMLRFGARQAPITIPAAMMS